MNFKENVTTDIRNYKVYFTYKGYYELQIIHCVKKRIMK